MPKNLDEAATSYRRAQAALAELQAQVGTARANVESARAELAEAIVEAARRGMRQVEIVQRSGYTRESVRRIVRAAGIEAD
ncbi:MAG TPA: hypothetical protein VGP91_11875 [Actinoplanes sp.]|jgi:multidrug resistance efflux pump|nr:hypothetical protein [Actinoplanes sp.]